MQRCKKESKTVSTVFIPRLHEPLKRLVLSCADHTRLKPGVNEMNEARLHAPSIWKKCVSGENGELQ